MLRFGFPFLLGFSCLFSCEGAVFPPSNGTNVTFIPESTGKVVWSFTDTINRVSTRIWSFYPSDGQSRVDLARIIGHGDAEKFTTSYEVAIEKPATLVLKNVNLTYNGTYEFSLSPGGSAASVVVVYIAVKPTVTACSSAITVNEGDDVSCTCQGQGGNPPADVTWYKDNRKIGGTGKEEKTLTLTNVTNEKDHGSYKCVVQSYPNQMFQDEVSVVVIVRPNYKPNKTKIEVPEVAYVGENLVINCSSDGLPAPSFTISHNVTSNIVSNRSRYIKNKVDYSDAGFYKCISKNVLGNDTDSRTLVVKEKRSSTKAATTQPTTQPTTQLTPDKSTEWTTTENDGCNDCVDPGIIVGICVAAVSSGVIVVIVVYHRKRKKNGRDRGGNDHELGDEKPVENSNAYDSQVPVASGSKSNASETVTLPPVYAVVDVNNRQGNTLYASLDTDAMKPKRESKKEPADRAPQTDYASIDFVKTAKAGKADPQ